MSEYAEAFEKLLEIEADADRHLADVVYAPRALPLTERTKLLILAGDAVREWNRAVSFMTDDELREFVAYRAARRSGGGR